MNNPRAISIYLRTLFYPQLFREFSRKNLHKWNIDQWNSIPPKSPPFKSHFWEKIRGFASVSGNGNKNSIIIRPKTITFTIPKHTNQSTQMNNPPTITIPFKFRVTFPQKKTLPHPLQYYHFTRNSSHPKRNSWYQAPRWEMRPSQDKVSCHLSCPEVSSSGATRGDQHLCVKSLWNIEAKKLFWGGGGILDSTDDLCVQNSCIFASKVIKKVRWCAVYLSWILES